MGVRPQFLFALHPDQVVGVHLACGRHRYATEFPGSSDPKDSVGEPGL